MRSLRQERKQQQRLAAKAHGINADFERVWGPSAKTPGAEVDILKLPVDIYALSDLQDQTTGELLFFPGISDPGGDDIMP